MGVRIIAGLAVAALIGGSIFFVKMSQSSSPEKAAETKEAGAAGAKPKLSYDLKDVEPKIDFSAIPEVIAEIGGKPISKEEYVKELKGFLEVLKRSNQPVGQEYMAQVEGQIKDKLVDGAVLVAQADKEGITADPAEVNANYDKMKKAMGDEARFQQYMDMRGFNEDSLKMDVAKNMRIRSLLDKNIISKINIDDKAAREFYDQNTDKFKAPEKVHAAHILVMPKKQEDPAEDKAAKAKADAILAKLTGGADFAATAKTESDDKGSGAKGGDLGFFSKEEMVPEFSEAAFSLEPGKLSGLVKSQFGYHIIKVFEKKPGGTTSFDEAKEGIKQRLKYQQFNNDAFNYIDTLYKDLNVKVAGADGKLEPIKPKPRPSHPGM